MSAAWKIVTASDTNDEIIRLARQLQELGFLGSAAADKDVSFDAELFAGAIATITGVALDAAKEVKANLDQALELAKLARNAEPSN